MGVRESDRLIVLGGGLPARRAYSSEREPTTWGRGRRICVARKGNMARIRKAG